MVDFNCKQFKQKPHNRQAVQKFHFLFLLLEWEKVINAVVFSSMTFPPRHFGLLDLQNFLRIIPGVYLWYKSLYLWNSGW